MYILPLKEVVCVQVSFKGVTIADEKELINYVKQINADITYANQHNKKDVLRELIDVDEVLCLYRKMKRKEEIYAFRIKHDCKSCYYFQERVCWGIKECLLEKV